MIRHRDTVLSGVMKLRTSPTDRFQIAAVGGLGIAVRQTHRSGTFASDTVPIVSRPVADTLSDTVLAFTAGLDGTVAITNQFGLVAVVRAHFLRDDDRLPDGVVKRGVSSVIFSEVYTGVRAA